MRLFFPVVEDATFSLCRMSIRSTISLWFNQHTKINEITKKRLEQLNIQIKETISREQRQIATSSSEGQLSQVLAKNIEFLNTVARSLEEPTRIGIFGFQGIHVQEIISSAIISLFQDLKAMNREAEDRQDSYRFSQLYIDVSTLPSRIIDFNKMVG